MTNQIQTTAELNTLEAQGAELGKAWKRIERNNRKQITDFDLPLGKLMLALEAEGNGQIKRSRLQECGIANIDRRRRNDAKHLAANWDELSPMVKRFTSTSALLKAWQKDNKANATDNVESIEEASDNATAEGKASDVGQKAPVTAGDIALEALVQCEANGIAIKDFMLALKEQLQMIDETKVAA